MALRAVVRLSLVSAVLLVISLPASAFASLRASTSIQSRSGVTRIVVKLSSTTKLSAKRKPGKVKVKAGGKTYALSRVRGAHVATFNLGIWRSAGFTGSAAATILALRGQRVTVIVRSVGGVTENLRSTAQTSGGTGAPPPPSAITSQPSGVLDTQATLKGLVNPNGSPVSDCRFDYGRSASYGASVPCTPAPGSGTSPVSVSGAISSLQPGTTYHFRVVASNASGTATGADQTFTTLLFTQPGRQLTGTEAYNSISKYFLNSEFSDCAGGRWPTCAVENRYEHGASGAFEYHRCQSAAIGADINFYDNFQVTGAEQEADGSWKIEYTDQNGAGFYHWEVSTTGVVNGYYVYNGGQPEQLLNYIWRQPAHLGDCYT